MQLATRLTLLFGIVAAAVWPSQMVLCQERDGSIEFEWSGAACCKHSSAPEGVVSSAPAGNRGVECDGCRDYRSNAWTRVNHAKPAAAQVGIEFRIERIDSLLAALPLAAPGSNSGSANPLASCLAATVLLL